MGLFSQADWKISGKKKKTAPASTERTLWIPAHTPVEVIFGLSCLYAYSYPNHKYPAYIINLEYFGYYYGERT